MNQPQQDHYEILGIPQSSTKEQIRTAYRKLSLIIHPDKRPANCSEESARVAFQKVFFPSPNSFIFRLICSNLQLSEANEVFRNSDRRAVYDIEYSEIRRQRRVYRLPIQTAEHVMKRTNSEFHHPPVSSTGQNDQARAESEARARQWERKQREARARAEAERNEEQPEEEARQQRQREHDQAEARRKENESREQRQREQQQQQQAQAHGEAKARRKEREARDQRERRRRESWARAERDATARKWEREQQLARTKTEAEARRWKEAARQQQQREHQKAERRRKEEAEVREWQERDRQYARYQADREARRKTEEEAHKQWFQEQSRLRKAEIRQQGATGILGLQDLVSRRPIKDRMECQVVSIQELIDSIVSAEITLIERFNEVIDSFGRAQYWASISSLEEYWQRNAWSETPYSGSLEYQRLKLGCMGYRAELDFIDSCWECAQARSADRMHNLEMALTNGREAVKNRRHGAPSSVPSRWDCGMLYLESSLDTGCISEDVEHGIWITLCFMMLLLFCRFPGLLFYLPLLLFIVPIRVMLIRTLLIIAIASMFGFNPIGILRIVICFVVWSIWKAISPLPWAQLEWKDEGEESQSQSQEDI
ncbi:hypothetical protein DL98DRAFT_591882 [Cadophora sp. DSE1049]|nr:hypothetical protein DL98DRAFT_591882 [Cadophora sp. DSE1049]